MLPSCIQLARTARGVLCGTVAATLFLGASGARAAGTDPTLAATSAVAQSAGGSWIVDVQASGPFDDLMQFPFAHGIVIWQGHQYALFDALGSVRGGTDSATNGGLTGEELALLLLAAQPLGEGAVLRVDASGASLALPSSFSQGSASVAAFSMIDDEAFVSNAVTVSLP